MKDPARFSFVPGPMPFPTVVGGAGVWLHTLDGRRILDGAGGAIVGNVGWGRPEVAQAVGRALEGGAYSVPLWPSTSRLALRDVMVERWLPDGFGHVFFTSGGSESTDSAVRLARAYQLAKGRPERWRMVSRYPSYHGMTLGSLAASGHDQRRAPYEPLLLDFPKVPWDDPQAVVDLIEREHETLAGFIAEPITGAAGGCLSASDEYWQTVTELCHRHDILLIADEVMTGYGRTGARWGHQHFPFQPDVIVGGKGLGGGYVPLGAVAARDEVAEVLRGSGFMYFTFSGNDAACAGGVAVLEILEREQLVERVAAFGPVVESHLRTLADHPLVTDIRGRGLFWSVITTCNRDDVVAAALERDLWVYPGGSGPVPNAVMIAPPFVITEDETVALVTRLRGALDAVLAAGA